jgi:hypothetical protein
MNNTNKLKFSELSVDMHVIDSDKNISIIKKCDDIHNILVKFEKLGGGGWGFYCLDENDKFNYEPLYKLE